MVKALDELRSNTQWLRSNEKDREPSQGEGLSYLARYEERANAISNTEKDRDFTQGNLLPVIQLLGLINRFARQVHADFTENSGISLRQNNAGMHLTTTQIAKLFHGLFGILIC